MTFGPRTFAPILTAIMVLWPIIGYMGAQGYTVAVALTGLLGIFYLHVSGVRRYAFAGIAFTLWVVAAGYWSPEAASLLTGNVFSGSFSMDMPGIRFALIVLAAMGTLVAIWAIPTRSSRISLGVMVGVALAQFFSVVITAMFMPQILALLAPISDPVGEMPQNLLRNANSFALLMPFLVAWMWHRQTGDYWRLAAIGLILVALAAFAQTGTQTSIVGAVFMLLGMLIVKVAPTNGFRIIFTSIAFYIATAPTLLGVGIRLIRETGMPLPESFFSRTYCWEYVRTKISEAPFFGNGLEASHSWKDSYADHPEWLADAAARYETGAQWVEYPIVPIHPHNMPLQVWAETGMVGACLAAAFVLFLGWRLKAPSEWPPIARYGAAGLVGICLSLSSFSLSMWNEAYWASVALAVGVVLLQARHQNGVTH
ncbi:MAG: O-antigen ligase family protein [Pseudomonadota bacterium]